MKSWIECSVIRFRKPREQQIHASCTVQGQLDFPLELADGEVCSLMGNLWDNALEACRRMTDGEKWIRFRPVDPGGEASPGNGKIPVRTWKRTGVETC